MSGPFGIARGQSGTARNGATSLRYLAVSARRNFGQFHLQKATIVANIRDYGDLHQLEIILFPQIPDINVSTYKLLAYALRDWDISHITKMFNRIWVKWEGKILPAILTGSQLVKIAKASEIEPADATKFIFELDPVVGLKVTDERVSGNTLTNADIRIHIEKYVTQQTAEKPPTLVTEEDKDGIIHLYDKSDGEAFYLRVRRKGIACPSFAIVEFISPTEVKITRRAQRANTFANVSWKTMKIETDATTSATKDTPAAAPTPPTSLPPQQIPKFIAGWAFNGRPLDPRVAETQKPITKKGPNDYSLVVCKKHGIGYPFKGLDSVFDALKTDDRTPSVDVKMILQDEELDGHPEKTVRLYRTSDDPTKHPERWLACGLIYSDYTNTEVELYDMNMEELEYGRVHQ
ncbi:MAG: hypothetical protein HQ596_03490 [Candidatus Saganbacteria bacterium]|nr:hypothetical protein [Candidatus Saganbacteria bacterium]